MVLSLNLCNSFVLSAWFMVNCKRETWVESIGYFTVVYLVAKPLIWSEAEGDLVGIETSIRFT